MTDLKWSEDRLNRLPRLYRHCDEPFWLRKWVRRAILLLGVLLAVAFWWGVVALVRWLHG